LAKTTPLKPSRRFAHIQQNAPDSPDGSGILPKGDTANSGTERPPEQPVVCCRLFETNGFRRSDFGNYIGWDKQNQQADCDRPDIEQQYVKYIDVYGSYIYIVTFRVELDDPEIFLEQQKPYPDNIAP
jgi:hypothetical protein